MVTGCYTGPAKINKSHHADRRCSAYMLDTPAALMLVSCSVPAQRKGRASHLCQHIDIAAAGLKHKLKSLHQPAGLSCAAATQRNSRRLCLFSSSLACISVAVAVCSCKAADCETNKTHHFAPSTNTHRLHTEVARPVSHPYDWNLARPDLADTCVQTWNTTAPASESVSGLRHLKLSAATSCAPARKVSYWLV